MMEFCLSRAGGTRSAVAVTPHRPQEWGSPRGPAAPVPPPPRCCRPLHADLSLSEFPVINFHFSLNGDMSQNLPQNLTYISVCAVAAVIYPCGWKYTGLLKRGKLCLLPYTCYMGINIILSLSSNKRFPKQEAVCTVMSALCSLCIRQHLHFSFRIHWSSTSLWKLSAEPSDLWTLWQI